MIEIEVKGARFSGVRVTIERITNSGFKVVMPVGTYFVARGNFQNMVSRQEEIVDLTTANRETFTIPAFSANLFEDMPQGSDEFDIVSSPEAEDLSKPMTVIGMQHLGEVISQVAVWTVTDDVSLDTLNSGYFVRRTVGGEFAGSVENAIRAMKMQVEILGEYLYGEKFIDLGFRKW